LIDIAALAVLQGMLAAVSRTLISQNINCHLAGLVMIALVLSVDQQT